MDKLHESHANPAYPSGLKVAKVLRVHGEQGTVDIEYLDGIEVKQVPVASGVLGTTHGFVHLAAPSYDRAELAKKTYPAPSQHAVHAKTNPSNIGRDQYCVVGQLESSMSAGQGGAIILGFFAPEVCEMLFPRDDAPNDYTFADFLLFRHPSDVQVTMDKNGKISVQHPNGSRITIGEDIEQVDLTHKDYDARYELRHNREKNVDIYLEAVDAAGEKEADVWISAGGFICASVYSGGDRTAFVYLSKIGFLEGYAKNEVLIHNEPGCEAHFHQDGSIDVHAPTELRLTAGQHIAITAPRVDIN